MNHWEMFDPYHCSVYCDAMVDSLSTEQSMTTNLADRITANPKQCGGRPCIRGMRIRVIDILELQAAGLSPAQILEELPDLEMEDIQAVALYALVIPAKAGI